jgi:hypothetical protein
MPKKMQAPSQARKQSTIPTKVYTYGVPRLEPKHAQIVYAQTRLAHKFRNRLVEIERERRVAYRTLRRALDPTLDDLETSKDDIENQIKATLKQLWLIKPEEREDSDVLMQLRDLENQSRDLGKKIGETAKAVEATHLAPYKKLRKERKAVAVAEYTADQGKPPATHTAGVVTAQVRAHMYDDPNVPEAWKACERTAEKAEKLGRDARNSSGCYPGVYQAIETAAKASFKTSKFMPKFVRFSDFRGPIGIQLTNGKGLSVRTAFAGTDPNLKIEIHPDARLRGDRRLNANRARPFRVAATARIKLSGRADKGVYIDVPFVLHRPLPEDGVIKWVYLISTRVGIRTIYELQFTLESPQFKAKESTATGTIAINFGWRALEDGRLRVATTFDGIEHRVYTLPYKMRETEKFRQTLMSFADQNFEDARKTFVAWLDTGVPLANSLTEKLSGIKQWKAHGKLAMIAKVLRSTFLTQDRTEELWRNWRDFRRLPRPSRDGVAIPWSSYRSMGLGRGADYDLFMPHDFVEQWLETQGVTDPRVVMAFYLEHWRRKDEHLINWARSTERRTRLAKREIYRVAAANLAKDYHTVIARKWDMSKTAETPETQDDTRTPKEKRSNALRHFAGVSVFTGALKQAFGVERFVEVTGVPGISSAWHIDCGGFGVATKDSMEEVVCAQCAAPYNEDLNAARHLYLSQSGNCESLGAVVNPGGARSPRISAQSSGLVDATV